MSQKRLDYLDMAKGVGIILVILGHIEYIQEGTMKMIYSFHMPLFFLIGGLLIYKKKDAKKEYLAQIGKRAKGLLIPYISFSITLLTVYTLGVLTGSPYVTKAGVMIDYIDTFTFYGVHILWFLPCYFLSQAIFLAILQNCKSYKLQFLLCIGILLISFGITKGLGLENFQTWNIELWMKVLLNIGVTILRSWMAIPFLFAGYWFGNRKPRTAIKDGALGLVLFTVGSYFALQVELFDLHYLQYDWYHYIIAIANSIGVILMCKGVKKSKPLVYLGRNSLIIMCTHATYYLLYYVSLVIFFVVNRVPSIEPIQYLIITAILCVIELPIIWFFNRYLKFLLGKPVRT